MSRDLPWGIILMSIAIAFFWRPIFSDNLKYLGACWVSALVLGYVAHLLNMRDYRNGK